MKLQELMDLANARAEKIQTVGSATPKGQQDQWAQGFVLGALFMRDLIVVNLKDETNEVREMVKGEEEISPETNAEIALALRITKSISELAEVP